MGKITCIGTPTLTRFKHIQDTALWPAIKGRPKIMCNVDYRQMYEALRLEWPRLCGNPPEAELRELHEGYFVARNWLKHLAPRFLIKTPSATAQMSSFFAACPEPSFAAACIDIGLKVSLVASPRAKHVAVSISRHGLSRDYLRTARVHD